MLAERHSREPFAARLVVLGDAAMLAARASRIGLQPRYVNFDPRLAPLDRCSVEAWNVPLVVTPDPGMPDPANARAVLDMLDRGADGCATGAFDALVTAPVQKSAILDAGFAFTGHTEYFAERTHTPRVVMMLVGGSEDAPLRVALVTTHLALAQVPAAITFDAVNETLRIVDASLRSQFGIVPPRIGVCGLNPHAGEGGHLGREEIDTIAPAIAACVRDGLDVHGPIPADTAFVPRHASGFHAIVAMFHDQGLPVLKAASFGGGVNVTLGLPFVRTSVDHGTALDLAADAQLAAGADAGSLVAAVELAISMARSRTA